MKLYQILKVFKSCQMIDIHWQHGDAKLNSLKPCSCFWNDYCSAKSQNKDNLGVFSLDVELITPNIDCMEIWLKPKGIKRK